MNMLEEHINYLLAADNLFKEYWDQLDSLKRAEFLFLNRQIDSLNIERDRILQLHTRAHEYTKRFFLKIQEKDFEYSRIPGDWIALVRNMEAKRELYQSSFEKLKTLISKFSDCEKVMLYGGIKPESSIDRKIGVKRTGNAVQQNVLDLWDVVRFRIVAPDLPILLSIGTGLWDTFFDQVVRCRNYYYRPKNGYYHDPYRAIHYEIEIASGRLIEVQLVSSIRQVMSLMDHSFFFKRIISFVDSNHKDWLLRHMWKGNILDAESLATYYWHELEQPNGGLANR